MESNETPGQDKKLQDDLKESAHRIWLAGLGALAAAEQEGVKVFNRLVDRGRDFESRNKGDFKEQVDRAKEQAKEQMGQAKAKVEETMDSWSEKLDDTLTAAMHRLGVPTREEIRTLTQRVEELNAKVEQLKPRVTPAGPAPVPIIVTASGDDPSKTVA
jgi:poly(hydroxyalkanoate) granule-associated protein